MAGAAVGVPRAHLPLAHDARAAVAPYLLGRHNVLAGRGVYLSVVDRARFRERAQDAYTAVLPDPASRLLTWTWPRWIPSTIRRAPWSASGGWSRDSRVAPCPPSLCGGARMTSSTPKPSPRASRRSLPHAEGPHLVTGRHFLQEDSGPEIAGLIADFLARLDGRER